MQPSRSFLHGFGVLALATALASPAEALSLRRADLANLVAGNTTILIAEVQAAVPRWNRDKTLILTEFQLAASDVLKGDTTRELSVTLMGGTVGETTTLIPGGAALAPGHRYVVFVNQEALPSSDPTFTVTDHSQGVFDLELRDGGWWATSQAAGAALVPGEDEEEGADVPGGAEGMSLDELVSSIKLLVEQGGQGGDQ